MHEPVMEPRAIDLLQRQFAVAWKLTQYHLAGLTDEECLWRPASVGPHVHHGPDGWRADWPETEDYSLGPPSIAWVSWHMVFWWSMVLDRSFGDARLAREDIVWPGSAHGVRRSLADLKRQWVERIGQLSDQQLASHELSQWPFQGRPFADVIAWLNVELMKNAAEIGYARFLFAARNAARDDTPR